MLRRKNIEQERKRKRKTPLSEKKEVCSKRVLTESALLLLEINGYGVSQELAIGFLPTPQIHPLSRSVLSPFL